MQKKFFFDGFPGFRAPRVFRAARSGLERLLARGSLAGFGEGLGRARKGSRHFVGGLGLED